MGGQLKTGVPLVDLLCRLGEANSQFTEIKDGVVATHEDISQNPASDNVLGGNPKNMTRDSLRDWLRLR